MDRKIISKINKMFNLLYDVESKYNLFKEQKDYIKEFMLINGYEMIINNSDKCKFKKIKDKR